MVGREKPEGNECEDPGDDSGDNEGVLFAMLLRAIRGLERKW